ncbi:MAG: cation:dicarboxylase symporter family transporter, partial [Burkholderiales bacterium]
MRKIALHWQILIAIILAAIVGWTVKHFTVGEMAPTLFGVSYIAIFGYVGEIFLNALKMIIVPLIFSSIVVGVAGIGSGGNIGSLGGRTLIFYAVTTFIAIMVGLVLINVIAPGYVDGEPAGEILALDTPVE